jgi:hypothetical protein
MLQLTRFEDFMTIKGCKNFSGEEPQQFGEFQCFGAMMLETKTLFFDTEVKRLLT